MKSIELFDGMKLSWSDQIYIWNKEKSTVTTIEDNYECPEYWEEKIMDEIELGYCKIVNNTYEIY